MARFLCPFLIALFLALPLSHGAKAQTPPELVFDAASGKVIYSEGADTLWYPASLTKLMTTYLVLEALKQGKLRMEDTVTMSASAAKMPPSRFAGVAGTKFTVQEGLLILIVKSANDVAYALAEKVGGSHDGFVRQMNRKARLLGMTRTNFANPSGLHNPNQVSTARDMARLAYAIHRDFPQYAPLFKVANLTVQGKSFTSYNRILGKYQGADGMKTGFVCASGYNVVASATRGGQRMIAITFGNLSVKDRTAKSEELLNKGFSGFSFGKPTIETLPEQGTTRRPVNMRPAICRKEKQLATLGPVPQFLGGSGREEEAPAASAQDRMMAPLPPRRPLSFARN